MRHLCLIWAFLCLSLYVSAQEANFEADQTLVCHNDEITFTALDTNADQFIWMLPGTTEEYIETEESTITVKYIDSPEDRTQDVTLIAINGTNRDSVTIENYIEVGPDFGREVNYTIKDLGIIDCSKGRTFEIVIENESADIIVKVNNRTVENNIARVDCPRFECDIFVDSYSTTNSCQSPYMFERVFGTSPAFDNIEFAYAGPLFGCKNQEIYVNADYTISTSPDVFLGDIGSHTLEVEGAGINVDGHYITIPEAGTYELNYHFKYADCEEVYTREVIIVDEIAIIASQSDICVGDPVQFSVSEEEYFNSTNSDWTLNGELISGDLIFNHIFDTPGQYRIEALFCDQPSVLEVEVTDCGTSTGTRPIGLSDFNWEIGGLPFQTDRQIYLEGLDGSENIELNIYALTGQKIHHQNLQTVAEQQIQIPPAHNGLMIMELIVDGQRYAGKQCW